MTDTVDKTTAASGIDATPTANPSVTGADPFASQREKDNDPFGGDTLNNVSGNDDMGDLPNSPSSPKSPSDGTGRRMSREWDASKVPPSQFQRRKGSIYSTPQSRDGHVKGSDRDKAYHEKLKEKGWNILSKK